MKHRTLFVSLLVISMLPLTVSGQFITTENGDNTITITGYSGGGGKLDIPGSIGGSRVTVIGDAAFQSVTTLTEITIPDSVTSIGHNAFAYCTGQTRITMGNGVKTVRINAFYGNTSLNEVAIGDGIVTLEDGAFQQCPNLSTVNFAGNSPTSVAENVFAGDPVTIYRNLGTTGWGSTLAGRPVVTLDRAPHISAQPTDLSIVIGSSATFQVQAGGTGPFTYQWYYTSGDPGVVAAAYALTISGFVYGAVVTSGGSGYTTPPRVQFVGTGVGASGYASVSNGGVNSITVTNAGFGYFDPPAVVIDPPSGPLSGQTNSSLTLSNFGPVNLGTYWVVVSNSFGSVTSSVAGITLVYSPSLAVPPADTSASLHGATTLSVTAAGTPPFEYQWSLAGTNLPSATNSTLELSNFKTNDVGSYTVTITSPYGSVTSDPVEVGMLPSLTAPFTGSVQLWGQPANLIVGAIGTGSLQYQWYYNGQPIEGATSNTLTLASIQFTDAGLYSVVVSSSLGSVTNTPYQVVVNPANTSLGLFPGVIISGTVGYVFGIQATTDLSDTNGWVTVTHVTLVQPMQIWIDYAADTTQPGNPKKFYRVVAGQSYPPMPAPTNMVWISPGTFTMGSPDTEAERELVEGPQTIVTLTRGFFMGKFEVTQGEYLDVMGYNPGSFHNGTTGCCGGTGDAVTNELRHPVEGVQSSDATNYCVRLTERERVAGRLPAGWVYRLPNEAEWEYACRAGTTTAFHYGSVFRSDMANCNGTGEYDSSVGKVTNPSGVFLGRTTPVGSYEPNAWGLYDIHGNVWEWCLATASGPLPGGRVVDPIGEGRMYRGGSWGTVSCFCRSADRGGWFWPELTGGQVGFRVVLAPGQ